MTFNKTSTGYNDNTSLTGLGLQHVVEGATLLKMKTNICGIYKITSPTGKIYIGQTVNFRRRINTYKKLKCNRQFKLYNSFIKYGFDLHKFEIVCECLLEELNEKEIYYIKFYNSFDTEDGLNLRAGGQSGKLSKESIDRIKISTKEYVLKNGNHCEGKKASEESKKKMSNSRKAYIKKHGNYNIVFTEEHRKNLSESHKGKKQSAESIAKRIAYQNKKIIQYDLDNNIIKEWESIKIASNFVGYSHSQFMRLVKDNKIMKNHIWKLK